MVLVLITFCRISPNNRSVSLHILDIARHESKRHTCFFPPGKIDALFIIANTIIHSLPDTKRTKRKSKEGKKGNAISYPAEVVIGNVVDLRRDYNAIRGTTKAV